MVESSPNLFADYLLFRQDLDIKKILDSQNDGNYNNIDYIWC
jgi:hypothetical protein